MILGYTIKTAKSIAFKKFQKQVFCRIQIGIFRSIVTKIARVGILSKSWDLVGHFFEGSPLALAQSGSPTHPHSQEGNVSSPSLVFHLVNCSDNHGLFVVVKVVDHVLCMLKELIQVVCDWATNVSLTMKPEIAC